MGDFSPKNQVSKVREAEGVTIISLYRLLIKELILRYLCTVRVLQLFIHDIEQKLPGIRVSRQCF